LGEFLKGFFKFSEGCFGSELFDPFKAVFRSFGEVFRLFVQGYQQLCYGFGVVGRCREACFCLVDGLVEGAVGIANAEDRACRSEDAQYFAGEECLAGSGYLRDDTEVASVQ